MLDRIKALLADKIAIDLLWSGGCLVLAAVGGLVTNIVLVRMLGAEALGIFGFAYALIVVLSHLASFGVQNSSLRQAAIIDRARVGSMLVSGVVTSAVCTVAIAIALFVLWPVLDRATEVDLGGQHVTLIAALGLFSVNKVYLATLNGLRRIRLLYSLQLLRVALILGYVLWVSLEQLPAIRVLESFLFSESIMLLLLNGVFAGVIKGARVRDLRGWMREHFHFGGRSFITGLSIEAHTRLDLLILAFFVDERMLGIYSFVAYFSEGLLQVIAVVRNNINPVLARAFVDQDADRLTNTLRQTRKWSFLVIAVAGGSIIALYLPALDLLDLSSMAPGWPILVILTGALIVLAPFLAFDTILTQFGRPEITSLILCVAAVSSLILNLIAIPWLGLVGAALATATSWALLVCLLYVATRRTAGLDLLRARAL